MENDTKPKLIYSCCEKNNPNKRNNGMSLEISSGEIGGAIYWKRPNGIVVVNNVLKKLLEMVRNEKLSDISILFHN